jgi:transposase
MVFEHQAEYESQWAAIVWISGKLGMTAETVRQWVRQAEGRRRRAAGVELGRGGAREGA